ncbi:AmmeMemoRadiSam system radical SAM enzyme [Candidatus Shapirobacteria bacterium]|nr:AmmeMemoRadiSam system radical SAM enzyme [Candidatus Shapirobacteria bacterium]
MTLNKFVKCNKVKKIKLFKKLGDDLVQCQACSWYCRIASGKTGICGVRENKGGELNLPVDGKTTGLSVDPIEKKPLYHFLPGSKALSFGTLGCNFGCLFCLNAWASQSPKKVKKKEQLKTLIDQCLIKLTPKQIVQAALDSGCQSIAYTYNEPAVFAEFAYETMKLAKKANLKNIWVSNGFESKETFNLIKSYLDGINIDLKSFNPEFYKKICKGKLKPVLENIKRFFKAGIWVEITTLVIPGENDSKKELKQIAGFIKDISSDIPWHLSAFTPDYLMKNKPRTNKEKLLEAREIGKKAGLNYVYLGNIWDLDNKYFSTYCPKCDFLLIERSAYRTVKIMGLKKGKCRNCGIKILGIWR